MSTKNLRWESKHSADNLSVPVIPVVVTDRPPRSVIEDFDPALMGVRCPCIHKTNCHIGHLAPWNQQNHLVLLIC